MARTSSAKNIKVEPANPVWGNQERACIEVVADVAGSLDAKYFTFQAIDADEVTTDYYLWLDNGSSVDPAPGGTGVQVVYADNDSAQAIRDLMVTALDALPLINCNGDVEAGKILCILENKYQGAVVAAADVDTAFVISVEVSGSKLEIGLTDNIEVGLAEELLDITSSQTGGEILARLRLGNSAGPITIPMKESNAAKLKAIIEVGGSTVTPGAGTAVTGWGSDKNFTNVVPDAKKLVLHPTRLPAADLTDDFCFWLAYPNLNTINFSGDAEQIINVEFTIYKDKSRVIETDLFVVGDHTQNLLV